MDKSLKKILYPGEVINNQDPMMLGRVRAYPIDQNVRAVLEAYGPFKEWSDKDPFVQSPLLPMYVSQVPDIGERVNILYQNSLYPYQDQYYVQAPFSSPMSLPYEKIQAANRGSSLGDRVKGLLRVKNDDGTFKNAKSKGIFPEPGDNALLGRGSSDVIVKTNSVLLRSGKTNRLDTNKLPVLNPNRAFLELTSVNTKIVSGSKKSYLSLTNDNQHVKKLIEWDIDNLETFEDSFTGTIRLYSLKPVTKTFSNNISYDTNLDDAISLEYYQNFFGLSFESAVKLINDFIVGVNNGQIPNGPKVDAQFPFAYRPNITIRQVLNKVGPLNNFNEFGNATKFNSKITLNPGLGPTSYKFAIVRSKGEVGKPIKAEIQEVIPKDVVSQPKTFMVGAADTMVLLSHGSNKKIDLTNNFYGTTGDFFENNILPNTSSTVRGEELIDLLNLIVRYLVAHVHPYHGMSPVPVATDGTDATKILFELQNAANKILNPNIRIN
jgi:hypothetical protein